MFCVQIEYKILFYSGRILFKNGKYKSIIRCIKTRIRWERDMKSFQLTKESVNMLAKRYATPLLVVSLDQIERNYRFLLEHLPRVQTYYAVKANPYERIITKLEELGSCFDVASAGEMYKLAGLGIAAERMIYANPIKTPQGLQAAHELGVYKFTFDSEKEIDKMAREVPGATVLLRIRVDNPKALVDLNEKFGAEPKKALDLLKKARQKGLQASGLCFHVGSQSPTSEAHIKALTISRQLFDLAKEEGFDLKILDIGGGLPIPTLEDDMDPVKIAKEIREALDNLFPKTQIWAEPGRFICGTAVQLLTSVIGAQQRGDQQWYFLDDGLYGTFSGILFDHWDFELKAFKAAPYEPATFAGPSCDSFDVLFRNRLAPKLEIGDVLLTPNCGAYTSASATEFNGFEKTPIIVWEDEGF